MRGLVIGLFMTGVYMVGYTQEKRDYVWQMGLATLGDTVPYSLEFDFTEGHFEVRKVFRSWSLYLTNTSISDRSGDLLMTTNGCAVYDSEYSIVENGDNLNPGIAHETQCENGIGYAVTDGAQFVHFGDSIIILIHLGDEYLANPLRVFVNKVYATTMAYNDGEIEILSKNELILQDTLSRGVECVKHSSGWWCVVNGEYNNQYHIIDISPELEFNVHSQCIGDSPSGLGGGQTVFSPDGGLYARFTSADQLYLFDFDRGVGGLDNFRHIHVSDSGAVGGVAFSSNSRYLYVSSQYDLYQLDCHAEDIQESVIHIAHYDGYFSPFPTTFFLMQLGPDCRIYMIPPFGVNIMHVIHDPNAHGIECNFEQHGIALPVNNSITLPSFPNYRLDLAPPCDPNITGMYEKPPSSFPIQVWPNPTYDYLNILSDVELSGVELYDLYGRLVFSQSLEDFIRIETINFSLPPGVYIFTVSSILGDVYTGKILLIDD